MNGKECKAYKDWGCWKEELCRFCIHPSCKERCFDYDLAGSRWSLCKDGKRKKRTAEVGREGLVDDKRSDTNLQTGEPQALP